MIITLIFLVLFLIPFLLIILGSVVHNIYSKKRCKINYDEFNYDKMEELDKSFIGKCDKILWRDIDYDIPVLISVISFIFIICCDIGILCAHVGENKNIEMNNIEYESLCQRLEIVNSEYEDMSKSDVIKDVSEWNKMVLEKKYWSKNPWTSWFFSQKVVDELKYIDYKKENEYEEND